MADYLIEVETSDFINVDADTDEEAIQKAIAIAQHDMTHEWKGNVMHRREYDTDSGS
jgi:hypothetical protein